MSAQLYEPSWGLWDVICARIGHISEKRGKRDWQSLIDDRRRGRGKCAKSRRHLFMEIWTIGHLESFASWNKTIASRRIRWCFFTRGADNLMKIFQQLPTDVATKVANCYIVRKPSAKVTPQKALCSSQRQLRATSRNASRVPTTEERMWRQCFLIK
jgi:hypothetical protein